MNNEEMILEMLKEMREDISGIKEKLEEVDQRSIRTQVLLETDVQDKLQLLFDGQTALQEKIERVEDKMATKEDLEVLKNDLNATKFTLQLTREDVSDLKKAE